MTSGPTRTSGSRGSPTGTLPYAAASRSTSASAIGLVHDQAAQARAALARCSDRREEDAADDEVEVGARRDDRRVVPAELEERAAEPRSHPRRQLLAHRRRARRGDERDAIVVGELNGPVGATDDELEEPVGDAAEPRRGALEERRRGESRERRSLRRLPDHRVSAHERQRGVPAPHRDREVEGADHGDRPERMPRLREPVTGALRRDRATVQLPRETDGEVADVDHLLHLAEAFLGDLPDLERDERTERLLLAAKLLAEQADELAATRSRHLAPGGEGLRRPPDRCLCLRRIGAGDVRDLRTGDRGADDEVASGRLRGVDTEAFEQVGNCGNGVDGRHGMSSWSVSTQSSM